MGWFDRGKRHGTRISDPVFGTMDRARGWWNAVVTFPPTGVDVDVGVEADEGPTPRQRSQFETLAARFAGLQPGIAEGLWELFRPWRDEFGEDAHAPTSPERMLETTDLYGIEIRRSGAITLLYAFKEHIGWDDASFRIEIDEWVVKPGGVDD